MKYKKMRLNIYIYIYIYMYVCIYTYIQYITIFYVQYEIRHIITYSVYLWNFF